MKWAGPVPTIIKGTAILAASIIVILLVTPYIMVEQNRVEPPIAVLTASKTVADVGETIVFDASSSSGTNLEYAIFYFNDGSEPVVVRGDPNNWVVSHSFAYEGVYLVSVRVVSSYGLDDIATVEVTIYNSPPNAEISVFYGGEEFGASGYSGGYPLYTIYEDESLIFNGYSSSDPDSDSLRYTWFFGDGRTFQGSVVEATFRESGEYPVSLYVFDDQYALDVDTIVVRVLNKPPIAGFTTNASVVNGRILVGEDDLVVFNASSTMDTPSDMDDLKFYWIFGDGSFGEGKIVYHRYSRSGTYNVTLVVVDDDGAKSVAQAVVEVYNYDPEVDLLVEANGTLEGETWIFYADSWDSPSDFPLLSYEWSFEGAAWRVSRTYIDDSEDSIVVKVIDDDGSEATSSLNISVVNAPPEIFVYDAYIDVNVTLRIAGERWHDVNVSIYRNGELVKNITLVREAGDPNEQSVTFPMIFTPYDNWSIVARYTPENDPVNGDENGANPSWINFTFRDPDWYNATYLCCELKNFVLLHHTFVVTRNDTWVWNVNLNEIFMHLPVTLVGRIFDQGVDDQKLEVYVNGTLVKSITYNSSGWPISIDFNFTVLLFPVHCYCDGTTTMDCYEARENRSWYLNEILFVSTDEDGANDTARVILYDSSGELRILDLAPKVEIMINNVGLEDTIINFKCKIVDKIRRNIYEYRWRMGDGTEYAADSVMHAYKVYGKYLVRVYVRDGNETSVGYYVMNIRNKKPSAKILFGNNLAEDSPILFQAQDVDDTFWDKVFCIASRYGYTP